MEIRFMFLLALCGLAAGVISAIIYNERLPNQPPLSFSYNPYVNGVYAAGIVESHQETGSDIDIFPEVLGTIIKVHVRDGQDVKKDEPLFMLDDSVQMGLVMTDKAQVELQYANLKNASDQLTKLEKSYHLNAQSVSKDALDNAINAVKIARHSVDVAEKQYRTDKALLDKFIVRAPADGKIIRVIATLGDYATPQGVFDSYTQVLFPVLQMTETSPYLNVRCFLDEILIPKLPPLSTKLEATLFVRGVSNQTIPLEYVYMQPYTQPNIQLPVPNAARVDIRTLPIIFRFIKPEHLRVYPGQFVDVYIKTPV